MASNINFRNAQQGVSGLWFKAGIDPQGYKHLLVSETRNGVENGSHDHYFEMRNGSYGVQIKNLDTVLEVKKGHLLPPNTAFTGSYEQLKGLFESYF